MTELFVVLTGLVLLLTVSGVVLLGRDRFSAWTAPARDGIRAERAPDAPLVLPEVMTREDVGRIAFSVRRRGYDPGEVHAVLERLARQLPDRDPGSAPARGA
jgi:DivIVA domain-containing protein